MGQQNTVLAVSISMKKLFGVLAYAPLAVIVVAATIALVFLSRGGMPSIAAWYGLWQGIPLLGAITLLPTIGYSLWKRRLRGAVGINLIVGSLALAPFVVQLSPFQIAHPADLQDTKPTATVRLPTDREMIVAWGGDTPDVNRHALAPDQRWAYDLAVEPAFHGSKKLEDFGCWGVPVVAPASGEIVKARDGLPDLPPGEMDPAHPAGNSVGIRLANGIYLVIAHLMNGSVSVEEGEAVEEGQPIGKCGNSGNTSEPHVHIHLQRQNPKKFPIGMALGLPLFFRDHDGRPMPEGGIERQDGEIKATGDRVRHIGVGPAR